MDKTLRELERKGNYNKIWPHLRRAGRFEDLLIQVDNILTLSVESIDQEGWHYAEAFRWCLEDAVLRELRLLYKEKTVMEDDIDWAPVWVRPGDLLRFSVNTRFLVEERL